MAFEGLQMIMTCPTYFQAFDGDHFPFVSLPGYAAGKDFSEVPCIGVIGGVNKLVLSLIGQKHASAQVGPGVVKIVRPE